ncbi:MAG TPA: hypothetical protein VFR73_16965 [Hyphomicrobiaceae bacterium]|nr:hypothetical protein [Hyphomicrobiaceae bacterium]
MRDESSANGHNAELESGTPQASHSRAETPLGTGNLTQELAQLLAATIAHNQAQRGATGGVPTGADLASLASLMTAASQHRSMSTSFKDGLSALSYNQPHGVHSQIGAVELRDPHHHDDEPMPIPSTWRQPVSNEGDRWFRQQMGAAALGLAAGLMIVVPTVLWLSGWIGSGKQKPSLPASSVAEFTKPSDVKTMKVQVRPVDRPSGETASQFTTGGVGGSVGADAPRKAEPPAIIATARVPEPIMPKTPEVAAPSRAEEVLAQAARRIEAGDITGARELLGGAEVQSMGLASFALAETYDPNMLAAWGTRGAVADVAKARALYAKALNLGVGKAMVRLEGLK